MLGDMYLRTVSERTNELLLLLLGAPLQYGPQVQRIINGHNDTGARTPETFELNQTGDQLETKLTLWISPRGLWRR